MKNILLIILLLVSHEVVQAADSLIIKADKLNDLYTRIIASKDTQGKRALERAFFDTFPESFQELVALYGYENEKPAILCDAGPQHIYELYNNLVGINDTTYLAKGIRISIGGKWDADAVSYFQDGLTQRIIRYKELTVFLLKGMSPEQAKSFWYFIFDGPHPDNVFKYHPGLKDFKSVDKDVYIMMMDVYRQVLADNDGHGH